MKSLIIALLFSLFANSGSFANSDSLLAMSHAKVMRLDNFSIRYRVSTKPILKSYSYDIERLLDIYSKSNGSKKEYSYKLIGDTNLTIIHDSGITYFIDNSKKIIDTISQNWEESLTDNISLMYLPLVDDYYITLLSDSLSYNNTSFGIRQTYIAEGYKSVSYFERYRNNILLDSSITIITVDTSLLLPVYLSVRRFGSHDTAITEMKLLDLRVDTHIRLDSLREEIFRLVHNSGYSVSKFSVKKDSNIERLKVGDVFPNLSLVSETGAAENLHDLKSQITILDFWYMSCLPCIASIPNFNDIEQRFSNDTVRIVSINPFDGNSTSKLSSFKKRYSVSYPTFFCNSKATDSLNINSFPRVIILDSSMRITHLNATPYFLPNIINGLVKRLQK